MKRLLFLLFVLPVLGFAQTSKSSQSIVSAVDYNDYIIVRQTKIAEYIGELVATMTDSSTTLEMAQMDRERLTQKVKVLYDEIKAMPSWNGSTTFRDAAVSLFGFYVETFQTDYRKIIDVNFRNPYTEDDQAESDGLIAGISNREKTLDAAFLSAQEKFASDNGFTLTNEGEK